MENTISLGTFELQLKNVKQKKITQSNNCIRVYDDIFDFLPDFLKYYLKGTNIGQSTNTDDNTIATIDHLIIPKLSESTDVNNIDSIVEEIYHVIPEVKEIIHEIKRSPNQQNDQIKGLPIIPIVFGLIFLLGVSDGTKNKKKQE